MQITAYSVIKFRKLKFSKAKGWVGKEGGWGYNFDIFFHKIYMQY